MYPFTRDDADIYIPIRLIMMIGEKSERIIVGNDVEVSKRLRGFEAEVYYDKERMIGAFLRDFDDEADDDWKETMFFLCDAFEKKYDRGWKSNLKGESQKELEEKALQILRMKYDSENPVWMYVALQMWFQYLRACERKIRKKDVLEVSNALFNEYERLLYPIYGRTKSEIVTGEKLTSEHALYAWTRHKSGIDMQVIVSYPSDEINIEYACTLYSLLGIKAYYAEKMSEKDRTIAQCDICGKFFLTSDKRKRLCSEDCEKENAKINRAVRRDNPRNLELDRLQNKENRYWDSRVKKLEEDIAFPRDQLEKALEARRKFRAEQKEKRKERMAGAITFNELKIWFAKQRNIINSFFDK